MSPEFIPYQPRRRSAEEMLARAEEFRQLMDSRRSVRHFAADPVPRRLIEIALETASSAPSGAHRQPWKFVAVSDPATKRQIRAAAEAEERETYQNRMPDEWRDALRPIGTDWQKPYLEHVPWIIVVFEELYGIDPDGAQQKNYYVKESVGIASGILLASLHAMGLATLTHTPSPMTFLSELLQRPGNERPFLLIPVGFPADACRVPNLVRKSLNEVSVWI